MKKIIKAVLAAAMMLSVIALNVPEVVPRVSAKVFGDYSYIILEDGTAEITNYGGGEQNLTIPETLDGITVSSIGYGAFAECKSIETLVVPDTVKTIQTYAFSHCSNLKEVTLPETMNRIGQSTFKGCISLTEINLPTNITAIPSEMLADCRSLTEITIPETVTSLGDGAFSGCVSITAITMPVNLFSIGSSAFRGCSNLEEIQFSEKLTTIGNSAFSDCFMLQIIDFPSTLRQIGQSAFLNCISLKSVKIPESITNLGYSVFSGCSGLTEVILPPNLEAIPDSAFSACSSLEEIEIPDSVTSLGVSAFAACVNLKSLDLPKGLESLGSGAFSSCNSLITVEIPSGIKEIPDELFRYCENLRYVVIPSSVVKIGSNVFANCPMLESVTFPTSIPRKDFGSTIFFNDSKVVLNVFENSGAWSYAINNNLKYCLLDEMINFDVDTLDLQVGDTRELKVIRKNYAIASNDSLTWTSSQPDVAVVEKGVITAKGAGTTVITAKTSAGETATCTVTVNDELKPITSITLSETDLTMNIGNQKALKATIAPVDTTDNKKIMWESNNPEVAVVSATGNVMAKGIGTAEIKAVAENGVYAVCKVTVNSPITNVKMNQTQLQLEMGASQQLRAMIEPVNTTDDTTLTWKSSLPNVATVDQEGNVTAVSEGYSIITVYAVNGKSATCRVEVTKKVNIPITDVTLSESELALTEGDTAELTATITPAETTDDKTLTWTSDNNAVATVDNGVITAVAPGQAKITVTTSNNISASCVVTVTAREVPIISVELDQTQATLKAGKTLTLHATINPQDTTQSKTLTWSSSDDKVATVKDGVVTAVAGGDAQITVTTVNGKTAVCQIHVFEVSLDALNDSIERADAVDPQMYTASSYEAMQKVLNEAKTVAADEDATQDQIDAVQQKLEQALSALVERCDEESLSRLRTLVQEGEALRPSYSEEEFAGMDAALSKANAVLALDPEEITKKEASDSITQIEAEMSALKVIDAMKDVRSAIEEGQNILNGDLSDYDPQSVEALREAVRAAQEVAESGTQDTEVLLNAAASVRLAISNLKPVEKEVDKTLLELFYQAVKDTAPDSYSEESWLDFVSALEQAQRVLADPEATQDAVEQANEALINAYSNLKPAVNYSALDFEIKLAKDMLAASDEYYSWDMEELEEVLTQAETIRKGASQDEVDQMVKTMRQLRLSIRKKAV